MLCSCFALAQQTLEVGKLKQFSTIKQAIKVAKDGDHVVVYPGVYREKNITIDKEIVISGIDYPVLDGQRLYEVVSIKANNVKFRGFKVINSGYAALKDPCGIKVYNHHYVRIENNILDNNFFGIYIQNGTHCVVKNNRMKAYAVQEQQIGNGIHAWKSSNLKIINNQIEGHRDGIYFEFVTESNISYNQSKRNIRYGLHFMFSHNDKYRNNTFSNNGAGVAVMYSRQVSMYNNTFNENWGDAAYGLLLKELTDSKIDGNKFIKNTTGIYSEGTTRVEIKRNIFKGNGWALKLQASCMDNTILRNNFLGNTFDVATNGNLTLNHFNKNYWDKYEGYDLDKDGIGDVPFHPLSLFSVLVERNPSAMLLFRSFMITLLDKSEKVLPTITPDNFKDEKPLMRPMKL
jgi:nitrous oxidase accessory protein